MLHNDSPEKKRFRIRLALVLAIGLTALGGALYLNHPESGKSTSVKKGEPSSSVEHGEQKETYPVHANITATVFWVGEAADESNKFIQNSSSAWQDDWKSSFGGVDDPEDRCDYKPCGFTPRENAFYFALPYNDLDDNGDKKASAGDIPWYHESNDTILKNRWIKITRGNKVAYAQWEDVGPFGEDDFDYVFGGENAKPAAPEAGLDLSPATADYLGVDGRDTVDWQFVEESEVAAGPWRDTVTTGY